MMMHGSDTKDETLARLPFPRRTQLAPEISLLRRRQEAVNQVLAGTGFGLVPWGPTGLLLASLDRAKP
jgi:hypothetical protein